MYEELKLQLIEGARKAVAGGLCLEEGGNFSVRVPDTSYMLITPSAIHRDVLVPDDILVVDLNDGKIVEGTRKPSKETPMHLAVLRARPDVNSVFHTHSVYATAFACLGMEIPPICHLSFRPYGGTVKVAPYRIGGSDALADIAAETLGKDGLAVLLEDHGVLACGRTITRALICALNVETNAQIYHLALQVGKPTPIAPEIVKAVLERNAGRKAEYEKIYQ